MSGSRHRGWSRVGALALVAGCAGSGPVGRATDGPPALAGPPARVDDDGDGADALVDCDDTDPTRYPGAEEDCNRRDDDCDPRTVEVYGDVEQGAFLAGDGGTIVLCDDLDGGLLHRARSLVVEGRGRRIRGVEVGGGDLVLRDVRLVDAPRWALEVNGGEVTVEGCEISGGTYGGVFAAGYLSRPRVTLRDCALFGNEVPYSAAAFYGSQVEVVLERVTFTGNSADEAGALYLGSSHLTARDVVFRGNTAGGSGGGLRLDDTVATWTGGAIEGNRAKVGGGGLYLRDGSYLAAEDVSIVGNVSDLVGGGAAVHQAELALSRSVVADNLARSGGGFHLEDAALSGSYTVVERNRAHDLLAGSGGGLLALGSRIEVEGYTFRYNVGMADGGGVHLADATLTGGGDTVVTLNEARRGGGIYLDTTLRVVAAERVTVRANHADLGGGVYGQGPDEPWYARPGATHPPNAVVLHEAHLLDNRARLGGGLLVDGTLVLTLGSALGNHAEEQGGAIYVAAGAVVHAEEVDMGSGGNDNIPEDVRTQIGHEESWVGTRSFDCAEICTTR